MILRGFQRIACQRPIQLLILSYSDRFSFHPCLKVLPATSPLFSTPAKTWPRGRSLLRCLLRLGMDLTAPSPPSHAEPHAAPSTLSGAKKTLRTPMPMAMPRMWRMAMAMAHVVAAPCAAPRRALRRRLCSATLAHAAAPSIATSRLRDGGARSRR